MKLAIVTATTDPARARDCIASWRLREGDRFIGVVNSNRLPTFTPSDAPGKMSLDWIVNEGYLGTVPAFRLGVDYALEQTDAEIIACLHDDLIINDDDWAAKVSRYFIINPQLGLCGFGGALRLGHDQMYKRPYDPQSLARHNFRSNLVDAEAHGIRSLLAERVVCLDGFSQIGSRKFWGGHRRNGGSLRPSNHQGERPWTMLESLGLVHHIYDGALGCLAARYGWETWYVPVRCRHLGGQTAVGDPGYADWAATQVAEGDQGFWREGHRLVYDEFRDVLPLSV